MHILYETPHYIVRQEHGGIAGEIHRVHDGATVFMQGEDWEYFVDPLDEAADCCESNAEETAAVDDACARYDSVML